MQGSPTSYLVHELAEIVENVKSVYVFATTAFHLNVEQIGLVYSVVWEAIQ
jgi:hypothetical protein